MAFTAPCVFISFRLALVYLHRHPFGTSWPLGGEGLNFRAKGFDLLSLSNGFSFSCLRLLYVQTKRRAGRAGGLGKWQPTKQPQEGEWVGALGRSIREGRGQDKMDVYVPKNEWRIIPAFKEEGN